ncbi:MAG: hypothetical protein Q6363_007270 [Candidatus Njordarchaeota archaeon]
MNKKYKSIGACLILGVIFFGILPVLSQPVSVEFFFKDSWWGTYQSSTAPEPGDKNVPLTVVIQQRSEYYLRGIRGYLYLTHPFKDAEDGDNISCADGVPIETEEGREYDVIPYGSFYLTFRLDIAENATVGEYTLELEIANYTAIDGNDTFHAGIAQKINITVRISNRAPEVKEKDPESSSVTIYVGENETFHVKAEDPDNDTITYRWLLDDEVVLEGEDVTNFTYVANRSDRGTHTLEVKISDGDMETVVSWSIDVPNRAPEIKEQEPSDSQVSIYVGDNRTFRVEAEDPDEDSITYKWLLDGDEVLKGETANNYTYRPTDDDVGSHTIVVEVTDSEDSTTRVTWTVNVEITSKTKVDPSAEYVMAGRKTSVNITLTNNIWQGTVEIDLSYPDYVAVFSDTHWTFRNVSPNDNLTVEIRLYVPSKVLTSFGEVELVGQTLDFTLDLSFTDRYGRSHSESHSAEFIIRGGVNLRYFGQSVEPLVITAGTEVEVSVTILNVGVATAQFANATVVPSDYIELVAESFYYIGDIEPGAPIPVVLKFRIKENVSPGSYTVKVLIYYFDDVYNEVHDEIMFGFVVVEATNTQTATNTLDIKSYIGYAYIVIALCAIGIAILLIRRRKS